MPAEVANAVAATVNGWARRGPFDVIWHGGEPLAAGIDHLDGLMAPFRGVRHHVQTNATLIDDAWCAFFEERDVRVGLSIDGPAERDGGRVTRSGRPAHGRIVRGIERLRREACRATCPYFAFCGGGQAANRYFEHGRFDVTRTCHCENSRISLMEGVVEHARAH